MDNPTPLDYERPTKSYAPDRPCRLRMIGLAIGCALAVPMIFLAIASMGAGHGSYFVVIAAFPLPMLVACYVGAISALILASAQWPLYAFLVGYALDVRRLGLIWLLTTFHVVCIFFLTTFVRL